MFALCLGFFCVVYKLSTFILCLLYIICLL